MPLTPSRSAEDSTKTKYTGEKDTQNARFPCHRKLEPENQGQRNGKGVEIGQDIDDALGHVQLKHRLPAPRFYTCADPRHAAWDAKGEPYGQTYHVEHCNEDNAHPDEDPSAA
ncbi:hypothetical protein VSDG_03096 [Cytospora chrysosperma]|uniref:Uncharacterized protein n=1 Tax=Cytospora chrysosperma TaxID=252740 RepID=A0A423W8Y7_CYTCH|nr:hypothetical protein VSDG_03096 [Valsa sordida]